nr:MAG TPA: Porphobilinogen deaminase, C-terminal domain [Caudoviricetes sp.]
MKISRDTFLLNLKSTCHSPVCAFRLSRRKEVVA